MITFPTILRRVSPAAIGRTAGFSVLPPSLRNGSRLAASKKGPTSLDITPEVHTWQNSARAFKRSSSTAEVPHCKASLTCAGRNPDGPAEEPLGKLKAAFLENNIIHQVETFCRAVEALDNVQVGITLLKHCTGFCKVVHLMRILPPATFGDLPSVVDEVVLQTFQHISGIVTSPLMVAQIRLPVSLGGFGITSCEMMAPTLYGMALIDTPTWISRLPMDLTGALQTISTFPELRPIVDLISQPVLTLETLKYKDHKEWSNLIYKHQFQQLVTSSTARDRARLVCLHNHSSGAWLEVCPSAQLGLRL